MIQINNVFNNANMKCIASGGSYFVYEHQKDSSVTPWTAAAGMVHVTDEPAKETASHPA